MVLAVKVSKPQFEVLLAIYLWLTGFLTGLAVGGIITKLT
jgi:hypothetical protein